MIPLRAYFKTKNYMGILYLLLSIVASSYIVLYFKYLEKFSFHLLPVVAVNYVVCVICGSIDSPHFWTHLCESPKNVFPFGIGLGFLFISIFFLIGSLTQKAGAGFVAILSKMCVVIPVLFSVLYLHEKINFWNISGIFLALVALVLVQIRKKEVGETTTMSLSLATMLPAALVFFGSGAIDTSLKIFNVYYSDAVPESDFSILIFGTAGIVGTVILTYMYASKRIPFDYHALIAGIGLGIPNYFSIVFLLKALAYIQGSLFFPLNNIGVVLVVCVLGIVVYREIYTRLNYVGVFLAIAAILLLAI